jgi:hypothetical protein
MAYVTVGDMVARLGGRIEESAKALVSDAIDEACAAIDLHCRQTFTTATAATARVYAPASKIEARVDPFWTTDGLAIATDDNDDGTAETTWTITTDFEVEPFDGPPVHKIVAVGSRWFPCLRRPSVQISARWGWASVPEPVHTATLILAGEFAKLKDAPFGVAGFGEFGVVRIRQNPKVA